MKTWLFRAYCTIIFIIFTTMYPVWELIQASINRDNLANITENFAITFTHVAGLILELRKKIERIFSRCWCNFLASVLLFGITGFQATVNSYRPFLLYAYCCRLLYQFLIYCWFAHQIIYPSSKFHVTLFFFLCVLIFFFTSTIIEQLVHALQICAGEGSDRS